MNVTTAAPFPEPDPDDGPQTESSDSIISEFTDTQVDQTFGPEVEVPPAETECFGATVAIYDGPGDHTVRPVPPSLLPYMGRHPRLKPPAAAG